MSVDDQTVKDPSENTNEKFVAEIPLDADKLIESFNNDARWGIMNNDVDETVLMDLLQRLNRDENIDPAVEAQLFVDSTIKSIAGFILDEIPFKKMPEINERVVANLLEERVQILLPVEPAVQLYTAYFNRVITSFRELIQVIPKIAKPLQKPNIEN